MASDFESLDLSFDTWGFFTTCGCRLDIQPRDQHYFERRLEYLANESLKRDIGKVEKEFSWNTAEGKRKLVRHRMKCRLKECR